MDQYCIPVNKADYEKNIRGILQTFRDILNGTKENDISLLNYYKGIPINYPATLIGIDNEFVEFGTHPYQAVAIRNDGSTFLKSAHFPREILAEVFYVRVPRQEVSLKNFLYTEVLAENRNYVRVALNEPTDTSVELETRSARGRLVDICLRSAAVDLPRELPIRPGAIARLRLALPMGAGNPELRIDVLGKMAKGTVEGGASRCVFDLQGDAAVEARIARFIGHRQTEIVSEIREAFWAASPT